MTPFERRLAKIEEIRLLDNAAGVRLQFWRSPEGMTDLAEQERWLDAQMPLNRDPEQRTLHVHFVRRSSQAER